ncbi:zinc finger protein 576 isoform X3 [Mustela lutreola]|uniref:Zinc finger protein 576 isoform X3 n=1 Tax=Mustela putorius furo TaxID=9669 RepID=A0A8U0RZG7_MUSPF|nr:zinc finger protein 576 isoform X3 [Mustela putorius furo]XP_059009756.1 zinc finger protein 576 isoform X3 [Mustela lutreola]
MPPGKRRAKVWIPPPTLRHVGDGEGSQSLWRTRVLKGTWSPRIRLRREVPAVQEATSFQERHMKREHPADFVAQKLQGALFICFTCARSFPSSKALIAHQRSHGPAARPSTPVAPTMAQPTFPCPDCGKTFGQAASLRRHRQAHEIRTPPGPFACTECGQDFAQEAGLHQHYIRHARGEL